MKIDRDHHKKCYDDCDCEVDDNINMINHENNDNDNDNNYDDEKKYDSDFNLSYVDDENRDIDDDYDVEFEKTRSFLYRHFIINIVVNEISKKFNFVFMKITLFYIKEKDNNSRMWMILISHLFLNHFSRRFSLCG